MLSGREAHVSRKIFPVILCPIMSSVALSKIHTRKTSTHPQIPGEFRLINSQEVLVTGNPL